MFWPTPVDYKQAISFFPDLSILDPELQDGSPRKDSDDVIYDTGAYSIVFPIEVSSNTYALRCWTEDIGDTETRYKEISDYLQRRCLPYFVDFEYVPNGIKVNEVEYPVTRMEWVEGKTLCDFIKQNLRDARCLKTAAAEFQKMVETLHAHQISHGDLQDGNILLDRDGTDVKIRLIDYDSLFVPSLRSQPDSIIGLPEYQHPQRGGGQANEKVDYFSELVIYLSLLSLAEKFDLWSQFGNRTEKGLLFTVEDFKNPDQSEVFRELGKLSLTVQQLASKLKEFCSRQSIDQLEPLEEVLAQKSSDFLEIVLSFWERVGQKLKGSCEPPVDQLDPSEPVPPPSPPQDPSDSIFLEEVLDFWKRDPSNRQEPPPTKSYNQGIAYLDNNQYNQAIVEFEKAIDLDPNYKKAHHELGRAYFEMGNFRAAKRALEAALRIEPKSTAVHYHLGCTCLGMQEYTKAANYFREAVTLDPKYKKAYYNLALTQLRRGYHQEAKKAAQAALKIDRNYQPARQLLAAIE